MNSTRSFDDDASVLTPEEALRREPEDLRIEDGAEVDISPDRSKHARCFARVRAKSISDLQILGLVPRGLSEEHLRSAIRSDDDSALQMARKMLSYAPSSQCHCDDSPDGDAMPYRNQLASRYASIRRSFNPALAELLSKHQALLGLAIAISGCSTLTLSPFASMTATSSKDISSSPWR